MKKMIMPIVVLGLICLVVTGALAVTYQVTDPIIKAAEAAANEAARAEVLPEGSGFAAVEADGLPERVTAVYVAENGAGYVFNLTTKGYGTMKLMVGIGADGTITGVKAMDVSGETPGIGDAVTEESFYGQFLGKDAALEGVETISGATYSSGGYIAAVQDAFTAFDMIAGKEGA